MRSCSGRAGDRAFCAGLDTQAGLRAARRCVEPRRPGRAPQPEVAAVLEAGRVRGARHLHRRRVLLRQRGRHRHLLRRRDVLRLARDVRAGLRARAGRADAQDRARRDAAHGAVRQRASGSAPRPRCGSAWSPRSWPRRRSGRVPTRLARRHRPHPAAATQGTVRAIWESLDQPYRAAMEQGLMYTRLGNPIGMVRGRRADRRRTAPPRFADGERFTRPAVAR